jgi:flagellar biosynthesis protein FlhA
MPGKQMAIDADLNAGLITEDEARERRQKIQREADFYGAMDGATKFVRGDAIAGIIITLVNIIGGFIIGALIRDMTLMDSLTTYTLLTIGDGIVTQIPALIVATSAGLIVTRTVSDTDLGQDLARQVVAYPRAVAVAGVAIVLLGLTGLFAREAFPPHIFGIVGLIIIILAMRLTRAKVKREEIEQTRVEREKTKAAEPAVEERPEALLAVDPMEIEIGYGLIPLADPKQGGDLLTRITHIRRQLAQRRGLIVPPIRIRDNMQLGPNEYIIKIKEIAVARGELLLGHHLAMNPGIATEELEGIETREPAFGLRAIWITEPQREKAQRLGYSVVDPSSVLATHLTEVIKSHGHELLTRQAVRGLIDNLKKTVPALAEELIPNVISVGDVQKVLQNLLREKVSIRNLELIMETLADYVPICKDHDLLTEYVRQALSRTICADYLDEDGKMQVMTLDPNIEKGIIDSVTEEQGITYSALPPQRVQEIIDLSAQASEKMARAGRQPIFLCAAQARLHYRRILMRALPNVVVLSYNEIDSSVTLESEGMVS